MLGAGNKAHSYSSSSTALLPCPLQAAGEGLCARAQNCHLLLAGPWETAGRGRPLRRLKGTPQGWVGMLASPPDPGSSVWQ